jgi:hypothetical protein
MIDSPVVSVSAILDRIDKLRDELMGRMDRLAPLEAHTRLEARVADMERRGSDIASSRAGAVEEYRAFERATSARLRALEEMPKTAADKKSNELRNLSLIVGAIVAIAGACNGLLALGVSLLLHFLK